jgi:hypothetical protein
VGGAAVFFVVLAALFVVGTARIAPAERRAGLVTVIAGAVIVVLAALSVLANLVVFLVVVQAVLVVVGTAQAQPEVLAFVEVVMAAVQFVLFVVGTTRSSRAGLAVPVFLIAVLAALFVVGAEPRVLVAVVVAMVVGEAVPFVLLVFARTTARFARAVPAALFAVVVGTVHVLVVALFEVAAFAALTLFVVVVAVDSSRRCAPDSVKDFVALQAVLSLAPNFI